MAGRICPWWIGYILASPLRRWFTNPEQLLQPFLRPGITVLEPGPGMGFFTIPMARMVGATGRVIAVDIQPRMLAGLRRRAEKMGAGGRIDLRLAHPNSLGLADLGGAVDLVLAAAVVHEVSSPGTFFREIAATLKPSGRVLFMEPAGHVTTAHFARELDAAAAAGLLAAETLSLRRTHAVVLTGGRI